MIKRGGKNLKGIAVFEIFLIVSMTFAFAVVINSSLGSADEIAQTEKNLDQSQIPAAGGSYGAQSATPVATSSTALYNAKLDALNQAYNNKFMGDEMPPSGANNPGTQTNPNNPNNPNAPAGTANAAQGTGALKTVGTGLAAAATVYTLTQGIGSAMGWQKSQTDAVSIALAGGIAAGTLAQGIFQSMNKGKGNAGASLAIGVVVMLVLLYLLYKKTEIRVVKFECLPFEPPLGGAKCEECNKDIFRPCSEYRCKALGQGCQLLNPGTGKELCAWVTKFDVKSPTITPWDAALNPKGLKYTPDNALRPGARGVKITNLNNTKGCLSAFTKLELGVTLNKPAQCKLDFNHTSSYDEMSNYFNDNYYLYNHSITFKLPGSTNGIIANNPELQNGKSTSIYTRCRDANGNYNVDEFVFSFCIDNSTDVTPPYIDHTSIISGSPVRYNVDSTRVEVYTDEPAQCRWSRIDKDYDNMENNMTCLTDAGNINNNYLYTCIANLTGIRNNEENRYFFRCKDLPDSEEKDRNVMKQSYPFSLRGTQPLIILGSGPNETIFGSTTTSKVTLNVNTAFGSDDGKAVCMFSPSLNGTYIMMFNTDSYTSNQDLYLTPGTWTYYFRCNDNGGNFVENKTTFTVFYDNQAPTITRVYKEESSLKIISDENAQCGYSLSSCNFDTLNSTLKFLESNPSILTAHYAPWKANSAFYIKCIDPRGNEPFPGQCNMIVGTTENSVVGA